MSPCLTSPGAKAKGASPVYFLPFLLAILGGEVGESLRQAGRRRKAPAVMKEGKEDIGSTDGECKESARAREGVRG